MVITMKFIDEKQFYSYFYNKNIENSEDVNTYINAHARDIFTFLQIKKKLQQPLLFLIGPGKNGRLALEIARLCSLSRIRVHIFIAQSTPSLHDVERLFKANIEYVQCYFNIENTQLQPLWESVSYIIDGLFATGISSQLDEHYNKIIHYVNKNAKTEIISLTLPSGMQHENIHAPYIKASKVIVIEHPLLTLLTHHFPIKNIICVPSNQPFMKKKLKSNIATYPLPYFKPTIPPNSHKYSRGTLFSFGGTDYFGASILTLEAILKINACMIHHFSTIDGKYPLLTKVPEIIFHDITHLHEHISQHVHQPTGVAFGFGSASVDLLQHHFQYAMKMPTFFPIILDAGALPLLKTHIQTPELSRLHPIIITPHLKEFAQLADIDLTTLRSSQMQYAQQFAQKHQIIVVLKSEQTLVTDGVKTWINPAGNPLMATPGSGDVLTGVILSHMDQTVTSDNLFDRVIQAVFRHSDAADTLIEKDNIRASDIIDAL